MVRSTRIIHKNKEYLIQEDNTSTTERVITFLGRPEASASEGMAEGAIHTNHGQWTPIAKWKKGSFLYFTEDKEKSATLLNRLLNKYLKDGNAHDEEDKKRKTYFYIELHDRLKFNIAASHPNGLAIDLYSKKSLAQKAVGTHQDSSPLKIRKTQNLSKLLIKAADQGYSGAILDNSDPIYFCLDPSENIVFMKLSMNEKDEIEEFTLQENGKWALYEGELDVEFYVDQDSCDQNMVRNLGDIPFVGHNEMDYAWTIETVDPDSEPIELPKHETPYPKIAGNRSIILFRTKQNAMDYMLEKGLFSCEVVRVEDLYKFLKAAGERKQNVLFEPFAHRSNGGALWINGHDVILDSFSGFWIMNDAWKFEKTV